MLLSFVEHAKMFVHFAHTKLNDKRAWFCMQTLVLGRNYAQRSRVEERGGQVYKIHAVYEIRGDY